MTNYSSDDLNNNWEFKIVRAETDIFRRPEVFRQLLEEEQMAGWEMVEKLDNRRVRFKRSKDERRKDSRLPEGYDPYRSTYGRSNYRLVAMLIALGITVAGMVAAIFFENSEDVGKIAITLPVILILMIVAIIIGVRRRK